MACPLLIQYSRHIFKMLPLILGTVFYVGNLSNKLQELGGNVLINVQLQYLLVGSYCNFHII